MITKTEEWLYNKAKEVHKDLELQDLYTAKFSFGGRWVMDLLEEYHKEQLLIQRVVRQIEQFYCADKLHLGKEMCKNQCTACNDYQSI